MTEHANIQGLLRTVNIRSFLPLDWEAVTMLGKELNKFRNDPFDSNDLADIAPPSEAKAVIIMVASVVIHSQRTSVPYLLPTKADLQALRPWIGSLEKMLRKISPKWAVMFGSYVEAKGHEAIIGAGNVIIETAEMCRRFEWPRYQFLEELGTLYQLLCQPQAEEGFFEDTELSIEKKIEGLFIALRYNGSALFPEVNAANFPLLFALMKKFNFPSRGFSDSNAGVAGAELMRGIENFLLQYWRDDIPEAPPSQEFDLFNLESWMRGFTETFFSERLEMVQERLPTLLWLVLRILPESGPMLADSIYGIADRIHTLGKLGVSSQDIARSVFGK